jgi:large subunit ribosomal protein L6
VEIKADGQQLTVKGSKGSLNLNLHTLVEVKLEDGVARVSPREESQQAWAMAGTFRALLNGMVVGVSKGYERKLELIGVGYRAQAQGDKLNLTLGFSHPVVYQLPKGVTAETPSQTEIVLKSIDKQMLGQAAAEVRGFRPPEPYKGKGVRYVGEQVRRKEAKKK